MKKEFQRKTKSNINQLASAGGKCFLILVALYFSYLVVWAQSAPNNQSSPSLTQQQIDEKQQQIDQLQKKEANYQQIIQLKQDKAQTLQNQVSLMDGQISNLQGQVDQLQQQIDQTSSDIDALSSDITAKEREIGDKRKILAGVIQSYYETNQDSLIELFLRNTNLSDFLSQADYTSQAGVKIDEMLASIVSSRDALDRARNELEKKNQDQREKQGTIVEKKHYLDDEQISKQQLLEQTHGEEQQYQQLLASVEAEKQQLLGDLYETSQTRSSELAAVEAQQPKPKSGLASTSWYFSQRDSRWGDQHIGFSNSTMKSYGCAVTSLAMVMRYHGININPGVLALQPIFYHDLIVWPSQWQGIQLASSTSHGNIDWNAIDNELKNKNPVIVFVKAVKRGAGHYVVIHSKDKNGQYVVHDPYWGDNIFLNSTRAFVEALYNSSTAVDQMIVYH